MSFSGVTMDMLTSMESAASYLGNIGLTAGLREGEHAMWERLLSAVERGVASDYFMVQCVVIEDSHESLTSTGSSASAHSGGGGGPVRENPFPPSASQNAITTSPRTAFALPTEIVSFPPPLFHRQALEPMGERSAEGEAGSLLSEPIVTSHSGSSGRGSMGQRSEKSQSGSPATPRSQESPAEPNISLTATTRSQESPAEPNISLTARRPRLAFSHGAAPIFRPASLHTRDSQSAEESGDEVASGFTDDSGNYHHREIILQERALHMAEESCLVDNDDVLSFLLESNMPVTSEMLELACLQGSAACAKLLHERCQLNFSVDMMMRAVASGFEELALLIAGTALEIAQLEDDDMRKMFVTAASRISPKLLFAVRTLCKKIDRPIKSLVQPIGQVLVSALCENVLRTTSAADLEAAAQILHFLISKEVPLPPDFARRSDDNPHSIRQHEFLVELLNCLVSFTDALLTAHWGSLPLNFCSADVFFKNAAPLPLVKVNLSCNNLISLPSVLFDGTMPTLRILNASQNNLLDLDSLQSMQNFSASRLEDLNLSFNSLSHFPSWLTLLPCLLRLNLTKSLKDSREASGMLAQSAGPGKARHSMSRSSVKRLWAAAHLEELYMAGNDLTELPPFILAMEYLHILDISSNRLKSLRDVCIGCPQLVSLRASKNQLEDRSPQVLGEEQLLECFPHSWHHSLNDVDLSHNDLLEVPPQLCQGQALVKLDLSHNGIGNLPDSLEWSCSRLTTLNLSDNQLGDEGFVAVFTDVISGSVPRVSPFAHRRTKVKWQALHQVDNADRRRIANQSSLAAESRRSGSMAVDIPADRLFALQTLDLSGNKLVEVPLSVCLLRSLVSLNLSGNVDLRILRPELGYLTQLFWLHLTNCPKLRAQLEPFLEPWSDPTKEPYLKVRDLLSSLLTTLRRQRHFYGLKVPVVGDEGCGKTQLISAMKALNCKGSTDKGQKRMKERVCQPSELVLTADGQPLKTATDDSVMDCGQQISLNIWDISDIDVLIVMRRALFMQRSLFLVVWDSKDRFHGLERGRAWIRHIQALSHRAHVILVATHAERSLTAEVRRSMSNQISELTQGHVPLCFVCSTNGQGIPALRRTIYLEAKRFCEDLPKVPSSYIALHRRLTNPSRKDNPARELLDKAGESGIMTHDKIMDVYNSMDDVRRDLLDDEEIVKVGTFLHDAGAIIHFHDLFQNLDNFYFLSVAWVAKTIVSFLNCYRLYVDAGILIPSAVEALFGASVGDSDNLRAFTALLEKMRVIFAISSGRRIRRYLVTFALPKDKPAHEANAIHQDILSMKRVKRLFSFNRVPPELWGVLVSQLQVKLENWSRGQFREGDRKVIHTVIWAQGMIGFLPTSAFRVESVAGIQIRGSSLTFPGINVIVMSTSDDYGALALIMQHINQLLDETFTNIRGSYLTDTKDSQTCYVPCPSCSMNYIVLRSEESASAIAVEQTSTSRGYAPHFLQLDECAGLLALRQTDICQNTGEILRPEELVPDLMFCDLPRHLIIDEIDVQQGTRLDAGACGTVYRCTLDGKEVAVKVYSSDSMLQQQHHLATMRSSTTGRHNLHNTLPSDLVTQRNYTTELSEVGGPMLKSLEEAQREASRLNRLAHPCVVAFLGASTHPPSIVMEYAPLGDLWHYLAARVKEKVDSFHSGSESHLSVVPEFPNGVLGRLMTNQIAYQVALGVQHIHSHGMIYNDLKANNVLLFSADPKRVPNVKLTDYNISTEEMPGVEVGLAEGTLGFQAPEVLLRGTRSGKVDIYSYAMFLYEMLEGDLPFYRERTNMKAPMALNNLVICGKRPALTSKTSLVRLEDLMHRCWQQYPDQRHSADRIVASMEKPEFNLQNRRISNLHRSADFIQYFCTTEVHLGEDHIAVMASKQEWDGSTFSDTDSMASSVRFSPDYRPSSLADSMATSSTAASLSDSIASVSFELLFVAAGEGMHRRFSLIDTYTDVMVGGPDDFPGPAVRCAVTVGSRLWVGTSAHGGSGSTVEVFDIHSPCRLREFQRFTKDCSVLCMASLEFPVEAETFASFSDAAEALPHNVDVPSSTVCSVVFAGLENGTLLGFLDTSPMKDLDLTVEENQAYPVTSIVTVSETEVWCAFGGDVASVAIDASTRSMKRLGNIALNENTLRPGLSIGNLVRSGGYVWASILNLNILLKFSISERLLLGCFQLNQFDQVVPTTHALSLSLPGNLLLKNFRPVSLSLHRRSQGSFGDSGLVVEKGGAVLSSTIAASSVLAEGEGANSVAAALEAPARPASMALPRRPMAATPDCIVSVKCVCDTLWLSLENGSVMVLGTTGMKAPAGEAAARSASGQTPTSGGGANLAEANLRKVSGELRPAQDVAAAAAAATPVLTPGLPSCEAMRQGSVRRRQRAEAASHAGQSHTLFARLNLVPSDEHCLCTTRHVTVTPSNLVVTSRQKPHITVTSPDGARAPREIVPLYTWDAWCEEDWHHFYRVIAELHRD